MKKITLLILLISVSASISFSQYTFGTNVPQKNAVITVQTFDSLKGMKIPVVKSSDLMPATDSSFLSLLIFDLKDSCFKMSNGRYWDCISQDTNASFMEAGGPPVTYHKSSLLNGDTIVFTPNGEIGIGISDPTSQLHIKNLVSGAIMTLDANTGFDSKIRLRSLGETKWQFGYDDSDEFFKIANGDFISNPKLIIDTNGQVGIGTITPVEELHIYDSNDSYVEAIIESTSDTGWAAIRLMNADREWTITTDGGNDDAFRIRDATSSNNVVFIEATASDNSLFIDSNGNVGIGTNNPSEEVHVIDTAYVEMIIESTDADGWGALRLKNADREWTITTDGGNDDAFRIRDATSGNNPVFIEATASNNSLFIDSNGNVGINTNNPTEKLFINSSNFIAKRVVRQNVSAGKGVIEVFEDSDGDEWYIGSNTTNIAGDNSFMIKTSNSASTEGVFFYENGNSINLGIGVKTPSSAIEVQSTDSMIASFADTASNARLNIKGVTRDEGPSIILDMNGNDDFRVSTGANNDSSLFINGSNGRVGIGTSKPIAKLHSAGDIAIFDPLNSARLFLNTVNPANGDYIDYKRNNIDRWEIGMNNTLESGSDVGSNFFIRRFDDAGASLGNAVFIERSTGNIGIGTSSPGEKLEVNGNVGADNFISSTTTYPDYVFQTYFEGKSNINKDYNFNSLEFIENYISKNKHLPGVKSIKEVTNKEGEIRINIAGTSIKNLEKIEELYIHTINLNKENKELRNELFELKKEMEEIKKLLKK